MDVPHPTGDASAPEGSVQVLTRVLSISGWGRSGSTLLDRLLGELDGFQSAGELHGLGRREGRGVCGCGALLQACRLWGPPMRELPADAFLDWSAIRRHRHHRRVLRGDRSWPPLARYLPVTERVYRHVVEATGARVIVDSTKLAAAAALVLHLDVDPWIVHLVRDPRAVAWSWQRRKPSSDDPQRDMPRLPPAKSSVLWSVTNAELEAVRRRLPAGRSILVRYEELIGDPHGTLERILALLGETALPLPLTPDGRAAILSPAHTVGGNPDRRTAGIIPLRLDDEWRTRMPARDRLAATIPALPFLRRYGYPVRVGRTPEA